MLLGPILNPGIGRVKEDPSSQDRGERPEIPVLPIPGRSADGPKILEKLPEGVLVDPVDPVRR
jgi:hypothetical protein